MTMTQLPLEIIGNSATLYMKDGTIRSGRILGFRNSMPENLELEFATRGANDPYDRNKISETTEIFNTEGIEAIDPYCK
jgi:hypothetical protein